VIFRPHDRTGQLARLLNLRVIFFPIIIELFPGFPEELFGVKRKPRSALTDRG
jgi:hypothetical protein